MPHESLYDAAILIVDDDPVAVELYGTVLGEHGFENVQSCQDSREVMDRLRAEAISVTLLDLKMPFVSGEELLPEITAEFPQVPVIVLTSEDSVDTAVSCMKHGAFDYLTKPVDSNRLANAVNHALKIRDLQDQVDILATPGGEAQPRHPEHFEDIVTQSPVIRRLFRYIEAVAPSPRPILITGESGTGKELVARAIHAASRRAGAFVAVNVSGLDDTMFSDTLFGHVDGAYTGATGTRRGLVEKARGGTLFLDEIGDLQPSVQVKLLRLLQEHEYYPLGADAPRYAQIRVVAATNADLRSAQQEERFRRDLYYRLTAHRVHLPPLRDRPEDIPVLLRHFVNEAAQSLGIPRPRIGQDAVRALAGYSFPGNVRELQSMVYDCLSRLSGDAMTGNCLSRYVLGESGGTRPGAGAPAGTGSPEALWSGAEALPTLREAEEYLYREALRRANGNQSVAARLLGVSQSTLSRRVSRRNG
ncbi:MAG: sigma-54-dependent transcriptional regulator [Spirochaetota bacterium]